MSDGRVGGFAIFGSGPDPSHDLFPYLLVVLVTVGLG